MLGGEDPRTPRADEARHWISVYTELVRFREQMLADSHEEIAGIHELRSRSELTRTLVAWSSRHLDALRKRLDFWRRRHLQLVDQPLGAARGPRPVRSARLRGRPAGKRKDRRPGRAAGPGR